MHIYKHTHTRAHACTHVHIHSRKHAHMHTQTHTHKLTHTCMHTHVHTCTYINAYTFTYALTHVHMHIHVNKNSSVVNKLCNWLTFVCMHYICIFFCVYTCMCIWETWNARLYMSANVQSVTGISLMWVCVFMLKKAKRFVL